jgi:HlyD family secretion protein
VVIKSDTLPKKIGATPKANEISDDKFECVFVMIGDKAELRIIKTGIQDDSRIEVLSGLSEEDQVIIGPYNVVTKLLDPGDKVAIETEEESEQ